MLVSIRRKSLNDLDGLCDTLRKAHARARARDRKGLVVPSLEGEGDEMAL